MLAGLLTQKAVIYTRRTRKASVGTPSYEYTKTYEDIPCRSTHMRHQFGMFDGRAASQSTHLIYFDGDAPTVDTTMQVEIDGTRFALEHVDPKYNRDVVHHVECFGFAVESPQKSR